MDILVGEDEDDDAVEVLLAVGECIGMRNEQTSGLGFDDRVRPELLFLVLYRVQSSST